MKTARLLPEHLGPAAWDAILPLRSVGPALEADQTVDFLVIGAGFAGLAAARRLTQLVPDQRIAVLDAGQVAQGAAGRNSGFMIDLPHELNSEDYAGAGDDRVVTALNRKAIAFARDAVSEFDIDPSFFDPSGKINGAASDMADAHNSSYSAHLGSLGEPFERMDAQHMYEVTGSRYYCSGLYTPGTVTLQPAGYIRGLAAGLKSLGVSIFENSPALSLEKQGESWVVHTPKATLKVGRIILTVNGHLESFGFMRDRLMHLFLFATMTPDLDDESLAKLGGQDRWGITPSDPMGTTMRRIDTKQGGNRIVTRTCAVLRSGMKARQRDLLRAERTMRQKFDKRFPQLAGLPMEHSWAGHLCLSMNGVAVMGELDTGIFAGCVQNGLGTARGTLTGIGAAELACGVESDVTRYFTAEAPPQKLPNRLVREAGANAVLRWKEFKARAE